MIEQLRVEMVSAFHAFQNKRHTDINSRETAWESYTKARELYLKESAEELGLKYIPLKFTIITDYNT